ADERRPTRQAREELFGGALVVGFHFLAIRVVASGGDDPGGLRGVERRRDERLPAGEAQRSQRQREVEQIAAGAIPIRVIVVLLLADRRALIAPARVPRTGQVVIPRLLAQIRAGR